MPDDPLSPLAEGAAAAHELYRSYIDAGFNESQALWLVAAALTAHLRAAGGFPPP